MNKPLIVLGVFVVIYLIGIGYTYNYIKKYIKSDDFAIHPIEYKILFLTIVGWPAFLGGVDIILKNLTKRNGK